MDSLGMYGSSDSDSNAASDDELIQTSGQGSKRSLMPEDWDENKKYGPSLASDSSWPSLTSQPLQSSFRERDTTKFEVTTCSKDETCTSEVYIPDPVVLESQLERTKVDGTEGNFFGLKNTSGSSDSDEETAPARPTAPTKSGGDWPHKVDSCMTGQECSKQGISVKENSLHPGTEMRLQDDLPPDTMPNLPPTNFWRAVDTQQKWSDPHSVWGVSDTNPRARKTVSSSTTGSEQNIKAYKSRKRKLDTENPDEGGSSLHQKGCLPQKCYYIHHKVGPYLQNTGPKVSKIPTNYTSDLTGHGGIVNRINWCTPQYSHLLLSASMDNTVKIWNAFSSLDNPCVRSMKCHSKAVKDAKWSFSGKKILSCSYDRTAVFSDVETGAAISSFPHDDFVTCVDFHPVDHNLFLTGSNNCLISWDCRSGTKAVKKYTYRDKIGQIQDIAFLPNGAEFFACSDLVSRDSADRSVMAWDFSSGAVLSNQIFFERYTSTRLKVVSGVELLAQTQGDYIAVFSASRPYRMNKCKRYEGHKVMGYSVGFDVSPSGSLVVSGSSDGQVAFYDYRLARCLRRKSVGQNHVVTDVAWHPVLASTVAYSTWSGQVGILS